MSCESIGEMSKFKQMLQPTFAESLKWQDHYQRYTKLVQSGCSGPKAAVSLELVQDILKNLKTLLESFHESHAKFTLVKKSTKINSSSKKSKIQLAVSLEKLLEEEVSRIFLCTKDFKNAMYYSWRCILRAIKRADRKVREKNVDLDYFKTSTVTAGFRGTWSDVDSSLMHSESS